MLYIGGMSYDVGTYVPLGHLNSKGVVSSAGRKSGKAQGFDFTFEQIGDTFRAVRHIPVIAL